MSASGRPAIIATRSRSASGKSSSPRMARSVILETSSFTPAKSASSSRHSQATMVESISATSRRFLRCATTCTQKSAACRSIICSALARTITGSSCSKKRSAAQSDSSSVSAIGEPAPATASSASGKVSCRPSKSLATRVKTFRMPAPADEPRIWLIAGPTASGKSRLALRLAQAAGGDIVNADSMQLYRDLAVLTARPARDETLLAPHHLYGVADASDGWSVGRWLDAARAELADIARWRRPAIVVGGTGLYFRALTQGLAEIPPVPRAVSARIAAEAGAAGELALRPRLARLDPEAEARIARGDLQRLVRALAVAEHTGRALTAWQADTEPALAQGSWQAVVIAPPRDALYAACDARLAAMFEAGAIEEVRGLLARGLDPALPAMKAVGVCQITLHLEGRLSRAEALARSQMETRRYAKRQLTWLRNQTPEWPRIEATEPDAQWAALTAMWLDG